MAHTPLAKVRNLRTAAHVPARPSGSVRMATMSPKEPNALRSSHPFGVAGRLETFGGRGAEAWVCGFYALDPEREDGAQSGCNHLN